MIIFYVVTESYVELPSNITPGNGIIAAPFIVAKRTSSDMQSKCTLCTAIEKCPSIPVCVKVTIERLPDNIFNSMASTRSAIAVGAYNYVDDSHVTNIVDARLLGHGTEIEGNHYTYSIDVDVYCQNLNASKFLSNNCTL